MRSVSYVQRVALEFSGSLFPHAICLGDVDNDTVSACALERRSPSATAGWGGVGRSGGGSPRRRVRAASAYGVGVDGVRCTAGGAGFAGCARTHGAESWIGKGCVGVSGTRHPGWTGPEPCSSVLLGTRVPGALPGQSLVPKRSL